MTDKELLEKAAKAAGLKNFRYCPEEADLHACIEYDDENDCTVVWMPHLDDGDAFRLAADVGLMVDFWHERVISGTRYAQGHRDWLYADDFDGSMPLAIIRVAAAMAR